MRDLRVERVNPEISVKLVRDHSTHGKRVVCVTSAENEGIRAGKASVRQHFTGYERDL